MKRPLIVPTQDRRQVDSGRVRARYVDRVLEIYLVELYYTGSITELSMVQPKSKIENRLSSQ